MKEQIFEETGDQDRYRQHHNELTGQKGTQTTFRCIFGSQPGRRPQHFHVIPAMAIWVIRALKMQGFTADSSSDCQKLGSPVLTATRDFPEA